MTFGLKRLSCSYEVGIPIDVADGGNLLALGKHVADAAMDRCAAMIFCACDV